jgi:hypothetical protein
MATARLIDSQKQELVRRFRQGESTKALADHFGCSATTITRMVKAELDPDDYAALRDQRQKKAGRDQQIPLAINSAAGAVSSAAEPPLSEAPAPIPVEAPATQHNNATALERSGDRVSGADPAFSGPAAIGSEADSDALAEAEAEAEADALAEAEEDVDGTLEPSPGGAKVLAIDDAEDFADDGDTEDDLLILDGEGDGDGEADGPMGGHDFQPVPVLPIVVDDQRETRPAPWTPDLLPSCAYLLVDKTVELQARPLAEIPELGRLPMEEEDQQALVLFTNPRQAKRHCGRTQRVIKLPDPALLGRTAPYLRAQGISRIVIEGALYALPGGH